jgi:methyl-accepting chemotaxis protein
MIAEIQEETGKAVEAMKSGTKEVNEGMHIVGLTDMAFADISEKTMTTSKEVESISQATQKMRSGTEQVAKAIDSVASVAEETASASEESASSTEELTASMEEMTARAQQLSDMAMKLQKSTSQFRLSKESGEEPKVTTGSLREKYYTFDKPAVTGRQPFQPRKER